MNAVRSGSSIALLGAVGVEQAQLDARGVLGEDREVRAAAVPGARRAGTGRRARSPSPHAPPRRAARSAPSRTSPAASTGSPSSGHGSSPKLARMRYGPRRTVSRRPSARAVASAPASSARAARARRGRASRSPAGSPRRVSLECCEGHRVLGVGDLLAERGERGELAPPALARRVAISGSMWSEKKRNGARSPYSSPWKSIGVNGARQVSSAASGRARRRAGGRRRRGCRPGRGWRRRRRSARARRRSAGAPKRRPRKVENVPSCTCGRWNALTSVSRSANSSYQPSVSPVSATRSAWWKSSAHAASQPQPPCSGRARPSGRSCRTPR